MCELKNESKRSEEAIKLFKGGLNCAQVVFSSFSNKYGIPEDTAVRIACGLGGGIRCGEVCGAVSGAVLVIGAAYGNDKVLCYEKTKEFTKCFADVNGSIVCRDLLGCNLGTKEGFAFAQENGLFQTRCVDMIKSAVTILEELGY